MSAYGEAHDVHVAELRAATQAHGMRIAEMDDLGAMAGEEAEHRADVDRHLDGMEHEMEHVGTCADDHGGMVDTSSMDGTHDACEDEMEAHALAMAAAPDVHAAHAEETWHQAAMSDWLDRMHAGSAGWMEMDGAYACPQDHPGGNDD